MTPDEFAAVSAEVPAIDLWARVDMTGDPSSCWEWQGNRNDGGYGRVRIAGTNRFAHRLAWTIARGPIPAGVFVCHHCDNPPCCNPAHLFLGTALENNRDRMDKGRGRRVNEAAAHLASMGLRPDEIVALTGLSRRQAYRYAARTAA